MLGRAFERIFIDRNIDYFATSSRDLDITDRSACESVGKPFTHLINCAAYTAVDKAEDEKNQAFAVNVRGVQNLQRIASINQAKLVHFSTDYVFDGNTALGYNEDDFTFPLSVYGRTKLLGESLLLSKDPNALIIRTSWLFGEGKNFVSTMKSIFKEKEEVKVIDDVRGRPTYARDLANAALDLLEFKGIYHFANREEVSWFEFAKEIYPLIKEKRCVNLSPISHKNYFSKAVRPRCSILRTEKVEKVLSRPIRSWKEALFEYLRE